MLGSEFQVLQLADLDAIELPAGLQPQHTLPGLQLPQVRRPFYHIENFRVIKL